MKKLACRYAIIQFVPYAETGEFANIGILMVCPKAGYFGFRLQTRRFARVTNFFDEISAKRYKNSVWAFSAELERLQALVAKAPEEDRADLVRSVFAHVTAPREALMRFGQERAILVDNIDAALTTMFGHYVDRNFATPQYVEEAIGRRLRTLIAELQLPNPFKPERIGNDEIHATFPLVQREQGVLQKAIKPFNLSQDEPNAIYDHGGTWLEKIRRLRKRRLLPPNVLFAVEAPPVEDGKRHSAYQEICNELRLETVEVVASNADASIVRFARSSPPPSMIATTKR